MPAKKKVRKSAQKEARQAAKMSYVARGKKNPKKRAKIMVDR